MRVRRSIPAGVVALAFLAMTACGETPQTTEEARGPLEGVNLVLALSVLLVVVAGAIVVGAIAFDRFVRSRRALAEAPLVEDEEEEEETEVVAGIGVGRAPVPRWLYGFYVLIPLFALAYVVSNVAPPPAATEEPVETAAPVGPQTEVTVVAENIAFEVDEITLLANADTTVTLDNQDAGIPHNLVIWESESAAQTADEAAQIAGTDLITGVAQDSFEYGTPDPIEYYFNCTVHPASMFGDVVIAAE